MEAEEIKKTEILKSFVDVYNKYPAVITEFFARKETDEAKRLYMIQKNMQILISKIQEFSYENITMAWATSLLIYMSYSELISIDNVNMLNIAQRFNIMPDKYRRAIIANLVKAHISPILSYVKYMRECINYSYQKIDNEDQHAYELNSIEENLDGLKKYVDGVLEIMGE